MINVNICNRTRNIRIAIIALLMLIFILTSSSVLSTTDPFTITEHTEYGLTENVVYVTVTENLDKDQNIDVSHIFIDHDLTDSLVYSEVQMNQSHQVDIYAMLNESIGKYKTTDIIYWDINYTDNDTGDNYTVTYNRTVYYDGDSIEMLCDHVLDDKSCLIVVHGIIGTETRYDYLSLPTLKEKLVINGVKIEQKESGIPLPKSSTIQLRYTVRHPIPYGPDYTDTGASYNKYNITVCSSTDSDECTTLDPEWYNTSWDCYRPIDVNVSENVTNYQLLLNITNKTNAQSNCCDMRFTLKDNVTELDYWIEDCNVSKDHALIWVNVTLDTYNETQIGYWYGNTSAVTSQSNATATLGHGIVSFWTFTGDADDRVGSNDGTVSGATLIEDRNGNLNSAYYFGGSTSDKIIIGNDASVQSTTGTIAFWWNTSQAFYTTVVSKCQDSGSYSGMLVGWSSGSGYHFATSRTGGAYTWLATLGNSYDDGNWHFAVMRYGTGGLKLYIDNTLNKNTTDTAANWNVAVDMQLGARGTNTFPHDGNIDDVRLYDEQLTDAEMQSLYISVEPTYTIGAEETQAVTEFIIYLNSPANATTTTDKTPDFNFTVNGSESTYACELFIDSTGYGTNATVSNDAETTITANASLDLGSYDWYVNCTGDGVTNSSDTWTLKIEPYFDVTLNAPVDYYNTSDSTPDFNYTVSGSEDIYYDCELFINDTGYGKYCNEWITNTDIITNLGDIGNNARPTVFKKDDVWYLISGVTAGNFHGFNWTGSAWQSDSNIVSGLGDIGQYSAPFVFYKNNVWYLISGEEFGTFLGYNWTGSAWQSDSNIISGLGDIGSTPRPTVFKKDDVWYLISGSSAGNFHGFNWTGSAWQSDSNIVSGLGDIGSRSEPTVFNIYTKWYLISGEYWGSVYGFDWTGITWQSNTEIVSGLSGGRPSPTVFYKDTIWYTIIGQHGGTFSGFKLIGVFNDTATIITANDTMVDGTYDWYVNCTVDSTVNQSSTRSITIDTAYSQIDFVTPTDPDNTNVTRNYTYLNWTVTELHQDTMILNWNGTNSTVTDTHINKTSLSEGTYTYYVWINDTAGNGNQSETRTFTIDISAPLISAYYQWDSANVTVDFGVWTEGFVSVNWNLTDVTGVNTSTCWIQVRNKDTVTGYTNMSYVDDLNHPDYDVTTGYKNLTCYTEDLGNDVTRISANMTRSYDWRPLNTAFDQDSAAHDNIYYSHGGRSTKIVFHNITNTINTTFIFLANVINQTNTVADHIFYSCNESYVSGDFTTDDNCAIVGAAHPNSTRDVNFDYLIGALMTDENGSFGGVVHTETMYGISYCPSCTNTGNSWITYSTNVYDGHSATSPNQGTTWTNLTGEEFNVILHVIDNTRLEFNLTIDDYLDNQLSDLQTDEYGPLGNLAPFGDITTDNITGSLVSYYDIHGITESGTICINVTVSDPNADIMNVSIYLLNNDSTMNQTLLLNQSVDAFGIICHQWDTTNVSNGDYRLNVTADDGYLIGYDESAGYIRIYNGFIPDITINNPANNTYSTYNRPSFNFTVTGIEDNYTCGLYMNSELQEIIVFQEDGDSHDTTTLGHYYVNYTDMSDGTISPIWSVKASIESYAVPMQSTIHNYTLTGCSSDPYQLHTYSQAGTYNASCWNGTGWYQLDNRSQMHWLIYSHAENPYILYDGDWSNAAYAFIVGGGPAGWWSEINIPLSYGIGGIYEEGMYWITHNLTTINGTATSITVNNVSDNDYHWNITCSHDNITNTSETRFLTIDSIYGNESTDFSSYSTSDTAWGFPDGIDDEDNTSLMLQIDVNFTQLSAYASSTPYSINISNYVTDIGNYAVYMILNSTDDNITYTISSDIINFSTEQFTGTVIYSIYINITQAAHLETKIQSSGYDTPWTYASVQLDDSITLNVSGHFWVHQALGTSSYFDANTQALHVYYDCGDVVMVADDLFSLGYTPAGYLITKENELDNSFNSITSCLGHPYSVAINMRAYDSASDNIMDKLTYNASFPNHNTTLAKQEFSMAIIADSGIDTPYIESSSSTYEPADTPKSGSGLDSPEDIIEEIKKRFIEERLLLCPTGYFFNHTSNRCEPYISPLAVLEQDIINCTRELFDLITRPVVISVPVYIQEHTLLGPQLVIPSIFFILLFVTALYIYYSKIPPKDIVSRLRKAFKTSRALRPSPAAITPVVGRQKVLRPAR